MKGKFFLLFVCVVSCLLTFAGNHPIDVIVDYQYKGAVVPQDYLGLSYETRMVCADANGNYYFTPENTKLVRIFQTLGIKSLRIGGSSVDQKGAPTPTTQDVDHLFRFAKAAGAKVIYSVRLKDGSATSAATLAKYIYDHYADQLDYFSIGNEPGYYKDYEGALQPRWDSIMKAMRKVAPKARFCAPDDNPNPILCDKLLRDYQNNPISLMTLHSYPGGCSYKNPNDAKTHADLIPFDYVERSHFLLSDELVTEYAKVYDQMEPIMRRSPIRMSETNSYWYSGLKGASNSFASALWGLDYLYWWASRGIVGMNFHTGDAVGGVSMPAYYATFVTEGDHFDIRPLSYAMKAFGIGGCGQLMPVRLPLETKQLSAYAKRDDHGFLYVTIVNKKNEVQDINLSLTDDIKTLFSADYILLEQKDADILQQKDITLGGSAIQPDGSWQLAQWNRLQVKDRKVNLTLPAYSAAIVKINTDVYYTVNSSVEPMLQGKYKPTWSSLKKFEVPEWYKNAKFGIWAHWGPQSVPEYGDWYAYYMYKQGSRENKYHLQHFGHPSKVGFKDLVHQWKAANWNPEKLMKLYKRAGAQYFVTLANHHDNFDLWDSQYHPWNAMEEGPHKNIVAGWKAAAEKEGLRFGVSIHSSRAWNWFDFTENADATGDMKGVPYDGVLTKEDGKGKWWEGKDPRILYARDHAVEGSGFTNREGKDAAIPDSAYIENYYDRTLDVINKYHPDLVYFDDSHLPLYPVSDAGLKIAAHYYNSNAKWHDGKQEGVITAKQLTPDEQDCLIWDVERGALDHLHNNYWQTCTCLGSWHYDRTRYTKNTYKTALRVIRMLSDIVSKNGNLLLSVPVRADGTIDEREEAILDSVADWMAVNKECIYDTRPWKVYGEGPDVELDKPMTNGGFNEGKGIYSPRDMRFTQKGKVVYVIVLQRPDDNKVNVVSMAGMQKQIKKVEVLGKGKTAYRCDAQGMHLTLPAGNHPIPVIKVTMR